MIQAATGKPGRCATGCVLTVFLLVLAACATKGNVYHDANMDFGSLQAVAVMPLGNLTRDTAASERVRDVFITRLLSTGAVYVMPVGEVARGIARAGIANPAAPSPEEIVRLAGIVKADAVLTGVIREYGEVRSSSAESNVISLSMQMSEAQTGKVVWRGSTTVGGISTWDRLFGGGGRPMNDVTERAVDDLIAKLFK